MTPEQPHYTSDRPFDINDHFDGLFVVCSDGRFEEHVNDFREYLRKKLGIRRLDRYFIPGAQLQFVTEEAGYLSTDEATAFWSRFYIDNHHLSYVVIVGHELCAAYRLAPAYQGFSPEQLRERQEEHLRRRGELLRAEYPNVRVHLYYMKPKSDNSAVDFFVVK